MKSITYSSLVLTLMVLIGLAATPAHAWMSCSGCQVRDAFTITGDSANNVGGSYTIQGSSAYSVSGDNTYSTYGAHPPVYGNYYWYVPNGAYAPDNSGADYYVLGGKVYK